LDGTLFLAYVKECLAPTLNVGDIVIMDNSLPKLDIRKSGRGSFLYEAGVKISSSDRGVIPRLLGVIELINILSQILSGFVAIIAI
jgi:hypothetical protein